MNKKIILAIFAISALLLSSSCCGIYHKTKTCKKEQSQEASADVKSEKKSKKLGDVPAVAE